MTSPETEPGRPGKRPEGGEDEALVARMAAGEENALALLYDRWAPRLYSIIVQLVGNPDESEDVLEDAFWHLWRTAGSFVPERGSAATWMLTVARNHGLERRRAKNGRKGAAGDGRTNASERPSLDSVDWDAIGFTHPELAAAAQRLSDPERRALELAYFHGLSQQAIAERVGDQADRVAAHLRSAVRQLRSGPEQPAADAGESGG